MPGKGEPLPRPIANLTLLSNNRYTFSGSSEPEHLRVLRQTLENLTGGFTRQGNAGGGTAGGEMGTPPAPTAVAQRKQRRKMTPEQLVAHTERMRAIAAKRKREAAKAAKKQAPAAA